MAITAREVRDFDRLAWNQRVESLAEGTIGQSTHAEGFHMVTGGGYSPHYLVAEDEAGEIVGQLVVLKGFFGAQEVVTHPFLRKAAPLCARAFGLNTWMQGPLVFAKERFVEVHRALLQDGHLQSGTYQVQRATLPFYTDPRLATLGEGVLADLGFAPQSETTFHVDLRQSHEALWAGLRSSARKNLRKIQEAGVLMATPLQSQADVAAYWKMLVETQSRSGRFVSYRTVEDFERRFWSKPHRDGVLRGILVRTSAGAAVAGLCFRAYNGWIQELGVAYSEFGVAQKLYGQDLIKWELMRWGHDHGYCTYDLMGVETDSADPKRRAIFQFKEKWGGGLVAHASYSKVYSPWRDAAVRLGVRLGRRFRRGRHRPQALAREER